MRWVGAEGDRYAGGRLCSDERMLDKVETILNGCGVVVAWRRKSLGCPRGSMAQSALALG